MKVLINLYRTLEKLVMVIVILNIIALILLDYKDKMMETRINKLVGNVDATFTVAFLLEAIIKVIAMGFTGHKECYLRDPFHWLDLIIVISGYDLGI